MSPLFIFLITNEIQYVVFYNLLSAHTTTLREQFSTTKSNSLRHIRALKTESAINSGCILLDVCEAVNVRGSLTDADSPIRIESERFYRLLD